MLYISPSKSTITNLLRILTMQWTLTYSHTCIHTYMYVCMYVRMYVCTYVCIYACIYVCMQTLLYAVLVSTCLLLWFVISKEPSSADCPNIVMVWPTLTYIHPVPGCYLHARKYVLYSLFWYTAVKCILIK